MIELLLIFALLAFIFKPKPGTLACGLAGFSGKRNFNGEKIKFLMYWNSIERGKDATGVFTPKSDIVKDNIKAESFINSARLTKKIVPDRLLIAHVRAKTVGANSVDNAHPFEYGNVVLAHNGTLENHLELAKMYSFDSKNFPVDSQILANCININTQHDDSIKVLEQYKGAAAILYYNKNLNSLFCYHDSKRPLFYGYVNGTEMYISSIKESLEAIDCSSIEEFEINTLYQISEGEIISKTKYTPKVDPIGKSVVASSKDLLINKKKQVSCKIPNIKGIVYGDAKGEYTKGFWMLCDMNAKSSHIHCKKEDIVEPGEWYLSLGPAEGELYRNSSANYTEFESIDGENGIILTPFRFRTTEFIPRKGSYGILMKKLVFIGSKQVLGVPGDIMFIKDYTYGDEDLTIVNVKTTVQGTCLTEHIRVATEKEIENHLKSVNQCEINFVRPLVDPEVEDFVNDKEKDINDIKNLLENNPNVGSKADYERMYSYGTICNIIYEIQIRIDALEKLAKESKSKELKIELALLNDYVTEFYFVDALYDMIPQTELDIELKKLDDLEKNEEDSEELKDNFFNH